MAKTIVITGIQDIDAKIRKLADPKLTNKIVRDAMKRNLGPILNKAKSYAPVDTGAYRKALKIVAGKRSRKGPSMLVTVTNQDIANIHGKAEAKRAKKALKSGKLLEFKPAKLGEKHYVGTIESGSPEQNRKPAAPMRRAYDQGGQAAATAASTEIRDKIMAALKAL